MKKIKTFLLFICLFTLLMNNSKAQFIQSYGITGGGTYATQRWNYQDVHQTETKLFHWGINASAFLEMGDYYSIRWISEIQYNRKGCKEEFPLQVIKNNEITYFSWNNYAKFRHEYENITPYFVIGGRLEYKFSVINGGFNDVSDTPRVTMNSMAVIHACVSGGPGIEFFIHSTISPFLEAQYFSDLPLPYFEAYANKNLQDLHIRNHGIELRIGFKFHFTFSNGDKCPPVYVSPGAF